MVGSKYGGKNHMDIYLFEPDKLDARSQNKERFEWNL